MKEKRRLFTIFSPAPPPEGKPLRRFWFDEDLENPLDEFKLNELIDIELNRCAKHHHKMKGQLFAIETFKMDIVKK